MERAIFKAAVITLKDTDVYREHQLKSIISSVIDKKQDKNSCQYFKNILTLIESTVNLNKELIKSFNDTDKDAILEAAAQVSIALMCVQEMFDIDNDTLKKAITIKIRERF